MRLTIFNCSPKYGKSNTEVLVDKFIEGFTKSNENAYEVHKLNAFKNIAEAVQVFEASEYVILAFPLYSFAMPSGVHEFIEALEPLCGRCRDKKIGFLVQFGLEEAIHARALEKYHIKLASLLGCQYIGTIIKGACDGLVKEPKAFRTKKAVKGIYKIGCSFGEAGVFDQKLLDQYAKPEKQTFLSQFMTKPLVKFINKYYWGPELKKNGTTDKSFAQPYK